MPSNADPTTTWFPSRVDPWLAALLVLAPLGAAAGTVVEVVTQDTVQAWIGLAGVALIGAIYGLLVFPMRYGVGRAELTVRFGVVRQRIRLADIRRVRPSSSALSSPALSLKRLRIDWTAGRERWVLVSPADREGFLALLAERAGLERRGEELVRATR